ncbi:MAG: YlmC/YmxH family sporulation protein [Clostridia bacterium]|nr:YlmC/YmxH family sporulation protein [Clostridia bacterium]
MQGIDYTFCELREKQVVNIADGKQLGRIVDIALHCSGKVVGLISQGDKRFFKNFNGNENVFIPWNKVIKIGDDVILVELNGVNSTELTK